MCCACRYRIDGDVGAAGHVSCGPQGVAHGIMDEDESAPVGFLQGLIGLRRECYLEKKKIAIT